MWAYTVRHNLYAVGDDFGLFDNTFYKPETYQSQVMIQLYIYK